LLGSDFLDGGLSSNWEARFGIIKQEALAQSCEREFRHNGRLESSRRYAQESEQGESWGRPVQGGSLPVLKRFSAKWIPVRAKKTRQIKKYLLTVGALL
jgi:hypothetical protein